MSRQHIDYLTSATPETVDGLDTGEVNAASVRPVTDGEPAQAAVLVRPTENLRTRTEIVRDELQALKYISDADRALLLTSTGDITWDGISPGFSGNFTATQNLILKPFTAPEISTASRLIICQNTASQITIRTRQNGTTGQPRAYSGANDISFDFTPVNTGLGNVIITVTGAPANNFHVQFDNNVSSGVTVAQMLAALNGNTSFVTAGLEAVIDGGIIGSTPDTLGPNGGPIEIGFPQPPSPVVGNKVYLTIAPAELLTRFMSGAADAEKHIITPSQLVQFFAADGGTLNKLIEGDVLCVRYDDLVMPLDGGRRQSIFENPEGMAMNAGNNLFLMRRFPARLPGALPLAAVINGQLIFVNGRIYNQGEAGALVLSGVPAITGAGPSTFSTVAGSVISVFQAIVAELNVNRPHLGIANTFTKKNTINNTVVDQAALVTTAQGTGVGVDGTGGDTAPTNWATHANGAGVVGTGGVGGSNGVVGHGSGGSVGTTYALFGVGVIGRGAGTGQGVYGLGAPIGGIPGVEGQGSGDGHGVQGRGGAGRGQGVDGVGGTTGPTNFGTRTWGAGVTGKGGFVASNGVVGEGGIGTPGSIALKFENVGVLGVGTGTVAVDPAVGGVVGISCAVDSMSGVHGFGNSSTNSIGVSGTGSGVGAGVVGSGNGNNAQGLVGFGGPNGAGVYAQSEGIGSNELFANGTGAGLKISAGGAASIPLILVPKSPALTVATIGALGMESYTAPNGSIARARLRAGVGNSERSGIRIAMTFAAPWNNAGTDCWYWMDSEGVVHLRGRIWHDASNGGQEAVTGFSFISLGTPIPDGFRPHTLVNGMEARVLSVTAGGTHLEGSIQVYTSGLIHYNLNQANNSVGQIYAINMDWPTW